MILATAAVVNFASSPLNSVTFSFFIGPMSDDLGWSRSQLAWGLTVRFLVAGAVGPFLGSLVDRHGSRWLGAGVGLVAGLSLIGLSRADELWQFYLLYAASGLAGFGVPSGALVTTVPVGKWFLFQRGRAMALATVGHPAGTVAAIAIAQTLIVLVGWRAAWLVLGLFLIAVLVPAMVLFMRRAPEDHGLLPFGGVALPAGDAAPRRVAEEVSWTRAEAMRSRTTWAILAAQVLSGFALSGTLLHRVAFWHDAGVPPTVVAIGTAADPFTVIFSALLFGLIAERVHVRYLGFVAGCGFAVSMLPMIFTFEPTLALFVSNIVWGFFAGSFIASNNLIWVTYFGRRALGAIQGIVLTTTVAANALAAPAYGALLDSGLSPHLVWVFSLVLFLTSGLLLLNAHPPRALARHIA